MNRPNASAIQPSTRGFSPLVLTLAVAIVGAAHAQTVSAVSGAGAPRIDLTPHVAMVAFVTSDADTAQEALKSAAISAAQGKVLTAIASKALPIPVVGGLPVDGALHVFNKFRKQAAKGYNVAYLQGLSAETTVQHDGTSFTVPASLMQGTSPQLLRIRPSAKDSARIVRSIHVAFKMTGSQVNPTTMHVLGTDQEVISCQQATSASGDLTLTPNAPLAEGEYAIVLLPNRPSADSAPAGLAWDFLVQ